MEIVKPNHVWAMDITYNPMAQCFVFLTCVMEVYSRNILSSVISNTLDARFCVEAYEESVSLYGSPEIMNTDQGAQFTSAAFVAAVAKRWIYRYIERYNTIRPHASLGGKIPDKIHSTKQADQLLKAS